ncbi:BamA/TamA family outer membrane protein [Acidobacteriota bacterium]
MDHTSRGYHRKKSAKITTILFYLFLFIPILCVWGADEEKEKSEKKSKDNSFIALPVIFYSPETKLAFGVGGGYYFRTVKGDALTNLSHLNGFMIYTLRNQFRITLAPDFYFKRNVYRLQGALSFSYFTDKLFGVGPDTTKDMEENFISRIYIFNLNLQRKIFLGFSGGIKLELARSTLVEVDEDGLLATGKILGSEGGISSGLGLALNWDTRDNINFPVLGSYHQAYVVFFRRTLGSDFHFTKYVLDCRKYFTFLASQVLAIQGYFSFISGDPPFQMMSLMGGQNNMRGYWMGRFRDKNLIIVQAEYRIPLVKRIGVVGFAGLGNVAERLSHFGRSDLKYSLGFGLRYAFNPKEKLNLRLDVGFTKEGAGFYITATEAF